MICNHFGFSSSDEPSDQIFKIPAKPAMTFQAQLCNCQS